MISFLDISSCFLILCSEAYSYGILVYQSMYFKSSDKVVHDEVRLKYFVGDVRVTLYRCVDILKISART